MKSLLNDAHRGPSGYVALAIFFAAYAATLALVISPDQVKATVGGSWTWPLHEPDQRTGDNDDGRTL